MTFPDRMFAIVSVVGIAASLILSFHVHQQDRGERLKLRQPPARLTAATHQDFQHFDATIVKDSQTGTEFLVVQSNLGGAIAITPIENTQTTTK